MDIIAIISIIVASAIGIAGIVIGYRTTKRSGAFKQPVLEVYLMNKRLIPDRVFYSIVFGCSVNEHQIVFCPLLFIIRNAGDLSAKNVTFRIVFPKGIRGATKGIGIRDDLLKYMEVGGPYSKEQLGRRQYDKNGFQYVDYTIPEIGPQSDVLLEEMADIASASRLPFSVDAVSKDGIPMQVGGFYEWTTKIDVRIQATDMKAVYSKFAVKYYYAENKEQLEDKIMQDETRALREKLKKIGTPDNVVSTSYAPGVREPAVLVMAEVQEAPKGSAFNDLDRSFYHVNLEKSVACYLNGPQRGQPLDLRVRDVCNNRY